MLIFLQEVIVSILTLLEIALFPILPFVEYLLEGGIRDLFILGTTYAVILSGILLLFHYGFKSIIAPRYFKLMWILIGLRLIIPFVPESEISLFNLFSEDPKIVQAEPFQADPDRMLSAYVVPGSPFTVLEPALTESADIMKQSNDTIAYIVVPSFWIWFLGAMFFIVQPVIANWRMNRRFRMIAPTIDERLNRLLVEIQKTMNCKRWVPIIITDQIPFPALMGLNFPRILLPTDIAETYSDDELRMIFTHELAHLKRRDIALNWVLAMIRVVHWINPLFWLVSSKIKKFGELTCDADVLKTLGAEKFRNYGDTLIKVAQRNPACKRTGLIAPVGLTGILSQKRNHKFLKSRIQQLKFSKQPQTRKRIILGWAIVASFIIFGMTNSAETALDPQKVRQLNKSAYSLNGFNYQTTPVAQKDKPLPKPEELTLRVYQVSNLVRDVKEGDKSASSITNFKSALKSIIHLSKFSSIMCHLKTKSLVIRATEEEHDKIREQIQYWRKHGWGQITVEIRFITLPEEYYYKNKRRFDNSGLSKPQFLPSEIPDLDTIFHPSEKGEKLPFNITRKYVTPKWISVYSFSESSRFIQHAQGNKRTNTLAAPKITLYSGQSVVISDEVRRPFVVGIKSGLNKNKQPMSRLSN